MYTFKGFVTNALFTNNARGVVSPIGEISTQSLTFAKDKGFYNLESMPDLGIVSFVSNLDSAPMVLTTDIITHILTIIKYAYDKSYNTVGQIYADELLNELLSTYASVADNFASGAIVNNGSHYIPEWISWSNTSIPAIANNTIKIWLSDQSFQNQYDEFEIVVIPPLANLNDFFKTGTEVGSLINQVSPTDMMNKIQIAKDGYPETVIRTEVFNYIDPQNNQHIVPTAWSVLIYGAAGNNIDAVVAAIDDYVLANSTHPRADWLSIIPDLFRKTEFILLPLWDQYSIPNRTLEAGIYSPISNVTKALKQIAAVAPQYPSSHLNQYTDVVGHPYKSLSILSVGGPDNNNDKFALTDVFPDYIDVSSTSVDFNRMSLNTQNWMIQLERMLIVAETMDNYTSVPVGMNKLIRDNILYLVIRFNNIHYLVVAKKNFPLPGV